MTQLKSLEWGFARDLSDVGFQQFTALTDLTRLSCDGWGSHNLSNELFRGIPDPAGKEMRAD